MKKIFCCLKVVIALVSYSCFSMPINLISPGIYTYTQKGDDLIDGQKASITWNVNLKTNHNAIVTISSWHAPFSCDGSYSIINEKDYLSLSWSQEENVGGECDSPAPQIFMKKTSSGEVLIRSVLFPCGDGDWHSIRKIH